MSDLKKNHLTFPDFLGVMENCIGIKNTCRMYPVLTIVITKITVTKPIIITLQIMRFDIDHT